MLKADDSSAPHVPQEYVQMTAIWNLAGLEGRRYPAIDKDLEVEVAIVGGGVSGLSTAIRLLEDGRKVAVLEALQVDQGSSGNSTGNLYGTLSQGLRSVRGKWEDDALQIGRASCRERG